MHQPTQTHSPENKSTVWLAEVGCRIVIGGKVKSRQNYEKRLLLLMAANEEDARAKLITEAQAYAEPYLNQYGESVIWQFDRILTLHACDFFDMEDLQRGHAVEIGSKIISKKP